MHLYGGQYPGSNLQGIKILAAEETKSQLKESQCEGLMKSKQDDSRNQTQHKKIRISYLL